MLNPISFRPGPVTFWTTLCYLALLIPILIINEEPPPAPSEAAPFAGVNLTEAWLDLTTITQAYHPYNSRFNDKVRNVLLRRIESILAENRVDFDTSGSGAGSKSSQAAVTLFNDMTSNITVLMGTSAAGGTNSGRKSAAAQAAYFEGQNIIVYIRGQEDDNGAFWEPDGFRKTRGNPKGLTLLNAHFDSVSTGYGATDDGMGVVTCLQAIRFFTYPGHQPKRGIVVMLNNGEEDWLYGARAFGQSPLLPYVHTFLNVEGAGAGGRALLFRTSDKEVTEAYHGTSDPFGTVIGSDAFGLGVIKSGTDYSVLHDVFGQRGLDLAFFKPRARYHTNQDDAAHASRKSLWHMLSATIHTMTGLSGDTGDKFTGPRSDGARDKVANGSPSDGVWFDLFGKGFVIFGLRSMFAWSLTVLVATPLILILVTYVLHKMDKYYFFSSSVKTYEDSDYSTVSVGGLKGFLRFPFALAVAGALTIGVAFLMRKSNPFIIYSSRYSVWAMAVSIFYFTFWAIMRGANFARPSALHRGYVNIWLFILGWIILVAVTVSEDRRKIGAGYLFVFLESAVFFTMLITLLELFALPKKSGWALQVREDYEARDQHLVVSLPRADRQPSPQIPAIPRHESLDIPTRQTTASTSPGGEEHGDEAEHPEPTERTPLVGGNAAGEMRTTFATTYRRSITALVNGARKLEDNGEPYEYEQPWSGRLPSWAWFLQFLILGPFIIVLVGQTGLFLTDAVHQTGSDGSSLLLPYLLVSLFSILVILPLTPFIHRVTHHIPVLLLVVFVATLVYNLVAFPFSPENRYKAYFLQTIDFDSGENKVCYSGVEEYVLPIIAEMPSASGRNVTCEPSRRAELVSCCYDGSAVPPVLGGDLPDGVPPEEGYADLVTLNVTRDEDGGNSARIEIDAVNTKACFLHFKKPVSWFAVDGGAGWDDRFGQYPEGGVDVVRLWRRDWGTKWVVDFEWEDGKGESQDGKEGEGGQARQDLRLRDKASLSGMDGSVVCMWSDANTKGTISALDEGLRFAPPWVALTKTAEGLVEGSKSFMV